MRMFILLAGVLCAAAGVWVNVTWRRDRDRYIDQYRETGDYTHATNFKLHLLLACATPLLAVILIVVGITA